MSEPVTTTSATEEIKPPVSDMGVLGWIKENLFDGWFNTALTLLTLFVLYKVLPPFVQWAFIDAIWSLTEGARPGGDGAVWAVIPENVRFILFGFFPEGQTWRPIAAILILFALVFYSKDLTNWNRFFGPIWTVGILVMGVLMYGGIFGLPVVETSKWSGFPLTLTLSLFGMVGAYPLGVLLALGRRSRMPAIKSLCVVYIELIRGVPLISLLFMSSVMFPLFLPEGMTIDKILRAQIAIILFTAAYIAEVVRGGLQAIPKGQYEAAESLGLPYGLTMRLIILPQALKIVIPPTVGILISAFKDTSLVVIIALYDLLKTTQVTLSNPKWMGFSTEAYIFLAILYFICCYVMSSFSRKLEKALHTGR